MWRVVISILIFCVLGAALNIGIAVSGFYWSAGSITSWGSLEGNIFHTVEYRSGSQLTGHYIGPLRSAAEIAEWVRREARTTEFTPGSVHSSQPLFIFVDIYDGGWPMRSLWGWRTSASRRLQLQAQQSGLITIWSSRGDGSRYRRAHLPARPIWPGFVINSAVYAMSIACLWYLPGLVRRARRRQRGACMRCGYSLAGLAGGAVCPECGTRANAPP